MVTEFEDLGYLLAGTTRHTEKKVHAMDKSISALIFWRDKISKRFTATKVIVFPINNTGLKATRLECMNECQQSF